MQLENQIGTATSYISSRDISRGESNNSGKCEVLSKLKDCLDLIITKIPLLSDQSTPKAQSVNVYNTTCHTHSPQVLHKQTQTSQVPSTADIVEAVIEISENENRVVNETAADNLEEILQCTLCNKALETNAHLDAHMEETHGHLDCEYCDAKLSSAGKLQEHISQSHGTGFLQCTKCIFRCQTRNQLNDHTHTCHDQEQGISTRQPSASTATTRQPSATLRSSALPAQDL